MAMKTIKKLAMIIVGLALLSLAGCDLLPGPNAILVTAVITNIYTPSVETQVSIVLSKGGAAFTDATVQINGTTCPENKINGSYSYNFLDTNQIQPGKDVTLSITKGTSVNISETLKMPQEPVNAIITTTPTSTTGLYYEYDAKQEIDLQWNSVKDSPYAIDILIPSDFTQNGIDFFQSLSNTTITYPIAKNTITTGIQSPPPVPINVAETNELFLLGSAFEIGSTFAVANTTTLLIYTQS